MIEVLDLPTDNIVNEEIASDNNEVCGCFPGYHICEKHIATSRRTRSCICRRVAGVPRPKNRPTGMMCAVERAIRNSPCRNSEYIFEPSIGTVFYDIEEAYEFCNFYSWEVRFGIRYGDSHKRPSDGEKSMHEFECQRSKSDKRITSHFVRTKCPALIRLLRTEDDYFYVSVLRSAHNHPLSETCGEKKEWNSHKNTDSGTKEMIRYLRENNISLSKIQSILAGWMPFGLFVGVNHHFQSTIFAGCFVKDETTESFKWVFEEFIRMMGTRAPSTILTDQCKAMGAALKIVMPETKHLWCKWHVLKAVKEGLGGMYSKNLPFREEFYYVINQMLTEDEFERAWESLLLKYNLVDNKYMINLYAKHHKWVKTYFKDTFFAGMSSTQRSESANHMLLRHTFQGTRQSICSLSSLINYCPIENGRATSTTQDKAGQSQTIQFMASRGSCIFSIHPCIFHAVEDSARQVCEL